MRMGRLISGEESPSRLKNRFEDSLVPFSSTFGTWNPGVRSANWSPEIVNRESAHILSLVYIFYIYSMLYKKLTQI